MYRVVLAAVDEETIVFVFGDHGMTETGDHGGESALETDSALLIYTPRAIFDPKQVSNTASLCIGLDSGNPYHPKEEGGGWQHSPICVATITEYIHRYCYCIAGNFCKV